MQKSHITQILQQLQNGSLSIKEAEDQLSQDAAQQLKHATISSAPRKDHGSVEPQHQPSQENREV